MDNDCLPCHRRSSTTLFDCLLFNSHDLAFDLSAPQRKSFRALRHHVTNVRQQLTVMGCQRGSLFPYPIPCIFYTLTAKNNFTASFFFFKLCITIYFLFFNFISHQWLQITQCWKTTVEPDVTVLLTPHWTVRTVVGLFCFGPRFLSLTAFERNQGKAALELF